MIDQSPEELEKKLDELKKTVRDVSKMKQFDEEDKVWWEKFWMSRSRTRARLGDGELEDRTPDPTSLKLVSQLFWPDPGQRVAAPPVAAMREVLGPADPLKDLAEVLTPRTTSANSDEFGRSRRVGYVTVLPGQDKAEQIALAKKKPPAASDLSLHKLFKSFSESRGETEGKFIEETFKVRQSFVFFPKFVFVL